MSFYIKIIGSVFLLFAALMIGKAYKAYEERMITECESFLRIVSHIKNKISCFLTCPSELLADFKDDCLEHVGFLPSVREGKSISDAFGGCESALAISKEMKGVLRSFFSRLGLGYKDEEVEKAASAERELSAILARERDQMPKNVKITNTLLIASALGIIILMI